VIFPGLWGSHEETGKKREKDFHVSQKGEVKTTQQPKPEPKKGEEGIN